MDGLKFSLRYSHFQFGALALGLGLAGCSPSGAPGSAVLGPVAAQGQVNITPPPASGPISRYIVKFKPTLGQGIAQTDGFFTPPAQTIGANGLSPQAYLEAQAGPGSHAKLIIPNLYTISVQPGQQPPAAAEIEFIEPDATVYALHVPNDPDYSMQWAHQNIHSEQAWDLGMGSHNVLVAEIDTGIDYTHPDLAANVYTAPDGTHGWNFVSNTNDPMADDAPEYHGTHVAGIMGAQGDNGVGVIGTSPNISIMALKFLNAQGQGNVSDAVSAIYYGIQKNVKIMSNSWGGSDPSQALQQAIDQARQAGILFIAAAGNGNSAGVGQDNDQSAIYPASYESSEDNMIVVAATDSSDNLTSFSNYGAGTVHIAAPGLNIYSTKNGSQYQYMSGTSMATPMVSGVAALMMGLRPDLSYKDIKNALLNNVDVLPQLQGKVISNGRLNSYRAMASIAPQGPGPSPTPTPTPTPTTPVPIPTPTPTQPPSGGVANSPLLAGQMQLLVNNPYASIPISYDVSAFQGAYGVYLEVSRSGTPFSNPNGNLPDPSHLNFAYIAGVQGGLMVVPARDLPGWGQYEIRIIPLNANNQAVGLFSNPSLLVLSP